MKWLTGECSLLGGVGMPPLVTYHSDRLPDSRVVPPPWWGDGAVTAAVVFSVTLIDSADELLVSSLS